MSGGGLSASYQPQTLSLLAPSFAICHVPLDAPLPPLADIAGEFVALARTTEEVTIVCPEAGVPDGIRAETGWRALIIDDRLPQPRRGCRHLATIAPKVPLWSAS